MKRHAFHTTSVCVALLSLQTPAVSFFHAARGGCPTTRPFPRRSSPNGRPMECLSSTGCPRPSPSRWGAAWARKASEPKRPLSTAEGAVGERRRGGAGWSRICKGAEVIFGECLFSWQRALALVTRCLGARNEIEMYTQKRTKTKITDVIFGSCSAPSLKAE